MQFLQTLPAFIIEFILISIVDLIKLQHAIHLCSFSPITYHIISSKIDGCIKMGAKETVWQCRKHLLFFLLFIAKLAFWQVRLVFYGWYFIGKNKIEQATIGREKKCLLYMHYPCSVVTMPLCLWHTYISLSVSLSTNSSRKLLWNFILKGDFLPKVGLNF